MKRIVVLLSLALLLAGGGAAGWWLLLREAPDEAEQAAAQAAVSDPSFVEVDRIMVPVVLGGRVQQLMSFLIVLEVANDDERRLVYKAMRQLKDAYIKELYVLLSRRYVWRQDDIIPIVKKRLLAASAHVMGGGIVRDIQLKGIESRVPQRT